MEYFDFLQQIMQAVREKGGEDLEISVNQVMKNNSNKIDTLTILAKGGNISPAFYVQQLYEQHRKGQNIEAIAAQVLEYYRNNCQAGKVDLSFYTDFSRVREHIACRLVNYAKNSFLLRQVPFKRYMDLAIVYYCRVDNEVLGKGSILVQNSHMELWDIDLEELHDVAVANTVRQLPYELFDLTDMLQDAFGLELDGEMQEKLPIYVLTNVEKYYGAVNILFDSVLEAVGEKLQSDFYILPSSIHECMIVPASEDIQEEELQKIVREINADYVAVEEVLGDSVYRYDRKNHFVIWEKG